MSARRTTAAKTETIRGTWAVWYCWCQPHDPIARSDRVVDERVLRIVAAHARGEHDKTPKERNGQ